jgi:hypothetical protein
VVVHSLDQPSFLVRVQFRLAGNITVIHVQLFPVALDSFLLPKLLKQPAFSRCFLFCLILSSDLDFSFDLCSCLVNVLRLCE